MAEQQRNSEIKAIMKMLDEIELKAISRIQIAKMPGMYVVLARPGSSLQPVRASEADRYSDPAATLMMQRE